MGRNGTTVQVNVYRLGDTTGTNTIDFTTRDGTARDGREYLAVSGSLTFGPLETVKPVLIPVLPNIESARNKTFALILRNPGHGAMLGLHDTITLKILPVVIGTLPRLTIQKASDGLIRMTVAPTAAGNSYILISAGDPGFKAGLDDGTNRIEQVAVSNSLDFLVLTALNTKQRFFRAFESPDNSEH